MGNDDQSRLTDTVSVLMQAYLDAKFATVDVGMKAIKVGMQDHILHVSVLEAKVEKLPCTPHGEDISSLKQSRENGILAKKAGRGWAGIGVQVLIGAVAITALVVSVVVAIAK